MFADPDSALLANEGRSLNCAMYVVLFANGQCCVRTVSIQNNFFVAVAPPLLPLAISYPVLCCSIFIAA